MPSAVSKVSSKVTKAHGRIYNCHRENNAPVRYSPMNKDDEAFDFLTIRRHVGAKVKDLVP